MVDVLEAPGGYAAALLGSRRCSRCGEVKPLDEFPMKDKARGLRRVWCRACCRAYGREHYERNRPVYLAKAAERNGRERPLNRERLLAYLRSHACVDCGEDDITLLDFDHRDRAQKLETISRLVRASSWSKVQREISKCDVRCANCHRRRTAQQLRWSKGDPERARVRLTAAREAYPMQERRAPVQLRAFVETHAGLESERRCCVCHELKPIGEFAYQRLQTGARQSHCRRCQAILRRQHYEQNRSRYFERAILQGLRKSLEKKSLLHEYLLAHPCVDCGETDLAVLEFDHRDPTEKTIEISRIMQRCWKTILREIGKCDVRCVNCHRRRTSEQQGWLKRFGEEVGNYARIAFARE